MIHLIYVSSATQNMDEASLLSLLAQARERNKQQEVTGMLLYGNGNFLQVLEGKAPDVDEIYHSITQDDRNIGNIVVQRKAISARNFPDWSMAFKALNKKQIIEAEGYSDFLLTKTAPELIAKNEVGIISLLMSFKDSLR